MCFFITSHPGSRRPATLVQFPCLMREFACSPCLFSACRFFDVFPEPESKVKNRRPEIMVDLSRLEQTIDPKTIILKIGGYGKVPASYDPETKIVRYQVPQKLRNRDCLVQFSVKVRGEKRPYMLPWRFYIERDALYLEPPVEVKAEPETQPVG